MDLIYDRNKHVTQVNVKIYNIPLSRILTTRHDEGNKWWNEREKKKNDICQISWLK
jgi:hypothetical protein